jgi:predicted nucleic-acid-binding protein
MNKQLTCDSNYAAQIVIIRKTHELTENKELKTQACSNVVGTIINGNHIIIGKDTPLDTIGIYVPEGAKLNDTLLSENNLYSSSNLNIDVTKKGYFGNKGRVKTQKFRGHRSEGYFFTFDYLTKIGIKSFLLSNETMLSYNGIDLHLKEGEEFNMIGDFELCTKYVNPIALKKEQRELAAKNKVTKDKRFNRVIDEQFRLHSSTPQLGKNLHELNENDIIAITSKFHGTSAVFSNVLTLKQLNWKERLAKWFGINVITKIYDNIYSSRTVIKNKYITENTQELAKGYYNEDIWGTVNEEIKASIQEGYTIYGEIVGFLDNGKHIQKGYDYGCKENEHKFLVYRITYTTPNNKVIELSWNQIKEYCAKHNLQTVPQYYFGSVRELMITAKVSTIDELYKWLQSAYNMEKDCEFCVNKIPAEGICVRIDGKSEYDTFKLKAFLFKEQEDKAVENNEVDIETTEASQPTDLIN